MQNKIVDQDKINAVIEWTLQSQRILHSYIARLSYSPRDRDDALTDVSRMF